MIQICAKYDSRAAASNVKHVLLNELAHHHTSPNQQRNGRFIFYIPFARIAFIRIYAQMITTDSLRVFFLFRLYLMLLCRARFMWIVYMYNSIIGARRGCASGLPAFRSRAGGSKGMK